MKKKILIFNIIFLMLFSVLVLPNSLAATVVNNAYFSIQMPSGFKRFTGYNNVGNVIMSASYSGYLDGKNYAQISYDVIKNTNNKYMYTKQDLIETAKSDNAYSGATIQHLYSTRTNVVKNELIELNGIKGHRVAYKKTYQSAEGANADAFTSYEYSDSYYLISDHYSYIFSIGYMSTNLIDSSAEKSVFNSIKIKDTAVKSHQTPFVDVAPSEWYHNAVKYVFDNNIIKGYDNLNFAPDDNLTRGMLATILYRMEGEPAISGKPKFPDVQDSKQFYYKAVKWATDKGVVAGYNTGKFGPNDNITREQLAVILNRYAKYKGKNVSATNDLKKFSDVSKISDYAVSSMKWAVGAGVITGNDNGTLNPKGNATRAEVSAMMEKYCKKVGR